MKVEEGKIVTLKYTITTEKGEMIESSAGRGEPLVFLFGKSGMLPGLDEAVRGMEVGDEREFDLPPEKAFGTIDSGPTMDILKTRLPDDTETKVGSMFERRSPAAAEEIFSSGPHAPTARQDSGREETRRVSSVRNPSVPAEPASRRPRS